MKTRKAYVCCSPVHGLSSVWLRHRVFVTFTLHFISGLHTGSLDRRGARARKEGHTVSDIFPACSLPLGLLPESLC